MVISLARQNSDEPVNLEVGRQSDHTLLAEVAREGISSTGTNTTRVTPKAENKIKICSFTTLSDRAAKHLHFCLYRRCWRGLLLGVCRVGFFWQIQLLMILNLQLGNIPLCGLDSCVTAFGTPPGKCLELARVKVTARR